MKTLYLKEIIGELDGKLVRGDPNVVIKNVVISDCRISEHTLIFYSQQSAISLQEMAQQYQSCAIVTDSVEQLVETGDQIAIVKVPKLAQAYWKFVRYYRQLFCLPIIGVTGTCGKTTTKEMIKYILSKQYNVRGTYYSQNSLRFNHHYLLEIDDDTQVAVYEMGVASPNDLLQYARYFEPQVGVITTIGIDHLNYCRSHDNYIREKGKMMKALKNRGTLILNSDDQNIKKIDTSDFQGRILYFGRGREADFQATNLRYAEQGMMCSLHHKNRYYELYVPGVGEHTIYNALAAIAATYEIGVGIEYSIRRLSTFFVLAKHLEVKQGINGCTLVDDTWSANPTSTETALKVLKTIAKGKKTVAVLGEMALLGTFSAELHAQMGDKLVEYGIDQLVTFDDEAKQIGIRALQLGMDPRHVFICRDVNAAIKVLQQTLDEQSIVLVKSSMLHRHSEMLIDALSEEEGRKNDES